MINKFILLLIFIIFFYYIRNIFLKFNIESYKNRIVYIFWTGGYDSTFRLCQLLIDERKIVQPIYISDIIDNLPNKKTRRHNHKFEKDAMKKIRLQLNKNYPFTKDSLLKTLDIKKVKISKNIENAMKILKSQNRVRRSVCQYGALAQVTKDLDKNIEICVENEPGSMLNKTMNNKLNCRNMNDCVLKNNLNKQDSSLYIFKKLIFSTINYSKKDMLNIANKNGYDNILNLTWSCWYPINKKPCGRCIMCRERII